MGNLFLDLDQAGAPTDVSAMGAKKTFKVSGSYPGQIITIEGRLGTDGYIPVLLFSEAGPQKQTIDLVASDLRVVGAPVGVDLSVSANDDGADVLSLPLNGTPVDVSALGTFNSVYVDGVIDAELKVQISEDSSNWADCPDLIFDQLGSRSVEIITKWMRVVYSGSGAPNVSVGASKSVADIAASESEELLGELIFTAGAPAVSPGQYADFEADLLPALVLAKARGIQPKIIFSGEFSTDFHIPAPAVPDTVYPLSNVELLIVRTDHTSGVTVTFDDGVSIDQMPRLNCSLNGKFCFDQQTKKLFTASSSTSRLRTGGACDVQSIGTMAPFDIAHGASVALICGGNGLDVETASDPDAPLFNCLDNAGVKGNGRLIINLQSGATSIEPDSLIRSDAAGTNDHGRIRVRYTGGGIQTSDSNWALNAQTRFNGELVTPEKQRNGPSRMVPNPLNGSFAQAPVSMNGGEIVSYDTSLLSSGSPDAAFTKSVNTMTMTDSGASFDTGLVGNSITIAGATSGGNNGTFVITDVPTATTIEYENAAGVAEGQGSATYDLEMIVELPSAKFDMGLEIILCNLAGSEPITVTVPSGQYLDGPVASAGLDGTDTIPVGGIKTYVIQSFGQGAVGSQSDIRWVGVASYGTHKSTFTYVGEGNPVSDHSQFNDWEHMMEKTAEAKARGELVTIVFNSLFTNNFVVPAPAVPGTIYPLANVELLIARNFHNQSVTVTLSDGIEFDNFPQLNCTFNGTFKFDAQTKPMYTAATSTSRLRTGGATDIQSIGTMSPFDIAHGATVALIPGGNGLDVETAVNATAPLFNALDNAGAKGNGRLIINLQSGATSIGPDSLMRSDAAGTNDHGRMRVRYTGGSLQAGEGNWALHLQSEYKGELIVPEIQRFGPARVFQEPADGSLATAPVTMHHGIQANFDTTAGDIAQPLLTAKFNMGISCTVANLKGSNDVVVSVPSGEHLTGGVRTAGLDGTDVVRPGQVKTYRTRAFQQGPVGSQAVNEWALVSVADKLEPSDFVFTAGAAPEAPNQYADFESMMPAVDAARTLGGIVRIIFDGRFSTDFHIPAPAVPGTVYPLGAVELLIARTDHTASVNVTFDDGVEIDDFPQLNCRYNGTFKFATATTKVYTAATSTSRLRTGGATDIVSTGTMSPFDIAHGATVALIPGGNGLDVETATDVAAPLFNCLDNAGAKGNGRLIVNLQSGATSIEPDSLIRSDAAGTNDHGRLRVRYTGGSLQAGEGNWALHLQSNYNGELVVPEIQRFGPARVFQEPANGTLATAPLTLHHGIQGNFDTTAGDIAQPLLTAKFNMGISVFVANLAGTNNVNMSVQSGEKLNGVTDGTYVVRPGQIVEFRTRAFQQGPVGSQADNDWAVVGTSYAPQIPTWATGVVVASHTVTLASPGYVLAVQGTTGAGVGIKAMRESGTVAAGEVLVAYDAKGVPTLTFNATDAITAASVLQLNS